MSTTPPPRALHLTSFNPDSKREPYPFFTSLCEPIIPLLGGIVSRTIAKALRVTKFDSVSTLLADYTGRNAQKHPASASGGNTNDAGAPATTMLRDASPRQKSRAGASRSLGSAGQKRGRRRDTTPASAEATAAGSSFPTRDSVYPKGKLEKDKEPALFAPSLVKGVGRRMVSVMKAGKTAASRRHGSRGVYVYVYVHVCRSACRSVARHGMKMDGTPQPRVYAHRAGLIARVIRVPWVTTIW